MCISSFKVWKVESMRCCISSCLYPFIIICASKRSNSRARKSNSYLFAMNLYSESLSGVPSTLSAASLIVTSHFPGSSMMGIRGYPFRKRVAIRVESTFPFMANFPWSTSHESRVLHVWPLGAFSEMALPSMLDMLDSPFILYPWAQDKRHAIVHAV